MSGILLTGASGFLGNIIRNVLSDYSIITIGRKNAHIINDLSKDTPVLAHNYSMVIHAAGKAHIVPTTEDERQHFFDVNVKGTINLLNGIENATIPDSFVFISTVGVYGKEKGLLINEDEPLLASDAYGKSKIESEKIVYDWCKKNNVICTILRLPLIAGPNPPGNLRTMINGIKKGYYFNIGGGAARKSIVLATDVAKIIPVAAKIGGIYNLTDGYHPSFFELSKVITSKLNKSTPLNIPIWLAWLMAKFGDIVGSKAPINSSKLIKITSHLTFDDSKAKQMLGWKPVPVLEGFKIE